MTTLPTCPCKEFRESSTPGVCVCTHSRSYHKRHVGPCWMPVKLGGVK